MNARHPQRSIGDAREMTVAPTLVRIVVILLAVGGACGHLAYLDAIWWHALGLSPPVARYLGGATMVLFAAQAMVALVCAVLAVVLALDESHRAPAALALAAAFGAWTYLMAYPGVTMLLRPVGPGFARDVFEAHFLIVELGGLASLVRFTTVFPRQLAAEELAPSDTLPAALLPFHRASVAMRRRWAPAIAALVALAAFWVWTSASGGELSDAGLTPLADLIRLGAAALVVSNLHRAWRMATEGDRDALMWIAFGLATLLASLAIVIGGNVLVAVTGVREPGLAWRPILVDVGTVGFFVGVALAVLHRGGRDPAWLTRRVATLTCAALLGLVLASGLEALFTGAVLTSPVLRAGVGTVVAFAVVLSTYRALARWMERVLPI